MKFKTVKKIIALALCAVMICCGGIAQAGEAGTQAAGGGVSSPMYTAINSTASGLTIGTLGKAACDGATTVKPNYLAGVVVELQQYDGGWTTIKEWSDFDWDAALLSADWYVAKGYNYRVKTTHYAYTISGKLIEEVTKYSKTVSY